MACADVLGAHGAAGAFVLGGSSVVGTWRLRPCWSCSAATAALSPCPLTMDGPLARSAQCSRRGVHVGAAMCEPAVVALTWPAAHLVRRAAERRAQSIGTRRAKHPSTTTDRLAAAHSVSLQKDSTLYGTGTGPVQVP